MVDFLTLFKNLYLQGCSFLVHAWVSFDSNPRRFCGWDSSRERVVFAAHARVRLAFLLGLRLSHPRRCETALQSEIPFDDGV